MMISIILLLTGILSCTKPNAPPRVATLERVDSIRFQESADYPIAGVRNIEISPDGKRLIVADNVSGVVLLYDFPKCNLLKVISPTLDMSDSLAYKGTQMAYDNHFVTMEQQPGFYSNGSARGSFQNACFVDDNTILISGTLYAYTLPDKYPAATPATISQAGRGAESSIMIYSLRTSSFTNVIPLETIGDIWPQTELLAYDRASSRLIVNMLPFFEMQRGHFDSAWGIASYSLNGKFKSWLAKEPNEIKEYSLERAGVMRPKVAVEPSGQLLYGYDMVSTIYNSQSSEEIPMNLPANNVTFFQNYAQMHRANGHISSAQMDSLFRWKPFWLSSLSINRQGYIVATSILRISEHPFKTEQLIQWYKNSGELLAEATIPHDSTQANISLTQYLPSLNQIAVITSDKSGWYLSRYSPSE